jgi:hypothetical protein
MIKTLAFILSASLAACAGEAEVRYAGNATVPEMVAMDTDPSVMVVANSDEPVFYSEHSYWLFRNQRWYRSSSYRGGWAQVDQPAEHVRRIERPIAYVHYRHTANPPRTTYNERTQPVPQRTPERTQPVPQRTPERSLERQLEPPDRPDARPERVQPQPDAERLDRSPDRTPDRTPSGDRDPTAAPVRPEPTPADRPQPALDRPEPTLERPGRTPPPANPPAPHQVPPVSMDQHDGPEHQIAPDPDRAPVSPGQSDRGSDQRPEVK